jgi:hypothetical protein
VQLLIATNNIIPVVANTVRLLCGQVVDVMAEADIMARQTKDVVLSVWWRHWQEIFLRIPTSKTARTLNLCNVFSNCMQYCAAWDVLMEKIMHKLLGFTKHTGSVSLSEFLSLVTAVTFAIIMVLGFGWVYVFQTITRNFFYTAFQFVTFCFSFSCFKYSSQHSVRLANHYFVPRNYRLCSTCIQITHKLWFEQL